MDRRIVWLLRCLLSASIIILIQQTLCADASSNIQEQNNATSSLTTIATTTSSSPAPPPSANLIQLQYDGNITAVHEQINLLFNRTDRNNDGWLSKLEFQAEFQTALDRLNSASLPLRRRLFDTFRNLIIRRPPRKSEQQQQQQQQQQQLNDLIFAALADNINGSSSISSTNASNDATLTMQIDRPTFTRQLSQIYEQRFPLHDIEVCQQAIHRLQTCKDRRIIYVLASQGDLITAMNQRCMQGFGYLSGYRVERCILAAGGCEEMLDCYSPGRLQQQQLVIMRRMLTWLYTQSADDELREGIDNQQTFENCRAQLADFLDNSILATTLMTPNDTTKNTGDPLLASWQAYSDCLRLGPDEFRIRFNNQTGLLLNRGGTPDTLHLHKRGLLLALFPSMFSPLAIILPLVVLGLLIAAPIITAVSLRLVAESKTAENIQLALNTHILVPARLGSGRPSQPFNLSDPTQGSAASANGGGGWCRPQLYWSTCGIPGTAPARNCSIGGGRLWRSDSCAGYGHFTEGSIICGRAKGTESMPGFANDPALNSSVKDNSQSGWRKFWDFLKMGPLRFQCQSLCVRFDPVGCEQPQ